MDEHRQRIATATSAVTLGELQTLVSDLQSSGTTAKLPSLKGPRLPGWLRTGWGMKAAAAAVLLIVGIGIGWGLYGNTNSPLDFTSDPGAKPDGVTPVVLTPPRQLQSLGGLTGLLEQMRRKFGDTSGYRLLVYPEYASLDRPDPGEERRKLNYDYRGGWDDPTTASRSSTDRLVDLSKFDAKALVGVLRGAPETLGIKPADVTSTYVIFDPTGDSTAPPDTLTISIYVSSEYGGGSIELNPDGSVKRISYPS